MEANVTQQLLDKVDTNDLHDTNINMTDLLMRLEKQSSDMETIKVNMNAMFLVIMGSVIIFMQAGFGFLEAGSIRAKNTTSILMKNFIDLTFGSLGFWAIGYGLAFGESTTGILGTTYYASTGLPLDLYPHLFFQATFAATCATIVSGAVAERCDFNAYLIYSTILTSIVYPISTHWCWGDGGWLSGMGFYDFAGSGVVHVSGGIHALIGSIVLGPRMDRFRDESSKYISGHSIPLISLGGFILIFGFFAFNAGSQASVSESGDANAIGSAVVATLMSCGTGGVTVLILWKLLPGGAGEWSLGKMVNGCLAGMVSVCAGCDAYYPWVAAILGCIAGVVYLICSLILVKLRIDDPLDASPIHLGAGLFGLIANPLVRIGGVLTTFSDEALNNLLWNAIGGGVLIAWHLIIAIILFVAFDKMGILRVTLDTEYKGMDLVKHKEKAYGFGRGTTPLPPFPAPSHNKSNNQNLDPAGFQTVMIGNNKVQAFGSPSM